MCVCHFYNVVFISFNWYQPCNQTTTIAGDIVDNDCDGLIDEETNNGIGMLHHIVFDGILNYIVIVLKYELWIRICREEKIMCTLVNNII
jgi:hypothetical protein